MFTKSFEISIHALREEGDFSSAFICLYSFLFLSTPSARRATYGSCSHRNSRMISIHALREEGDSVPAGIVVANSRISIHALREEGDIELVFDALFQRISIHALREEGDGIVGG